MDWFRILTIMNSVALIILLIASIIAAVSAIKVLRRIDSMTSKAQNIADNADALVSTLKSSATLAVASKVVNSLYKNYSSRPRKKYNKSS